MRPSSVPDCPGSLGHHDVRADVIALCRIFVRTSTIVTRCEAIERERCLGKLLDGTAPDGMLHQ